LLKAALLHPKSTAIAMQGLKSP
jgi:hypothetical protein